MANLKPSSQILLLPIALTPQQKEPLNHLSTTLTPGINNAGLKNH